MKPIVIASIIAIASTTAASAYTCKNTAEIVDGETVYTYSQCGTQAPASQAVLDMMTYAANNNEVDEVEEEVIVAPVVVAPAPTVNPNKAINKNIRKLNKQIKNLKAKKKNKDGKHKAKIKAKKSERKALKGQRV